jgi:hypothetical protein
MFTNQSRIWRVLLFLLSLSFGCFGREKKEKRDERKKIFKKIKKNDIKKKEPQTQTRIRIQQEKCASLTRILHVPLSPSTAPFVILLSEGWPKPQEHTGRGMVKVIEYLSLQTTPYTVGFGVFIIFGCFGRKKKEKK